MIDKFNPRKVHCLKMVNAFLEVLFHEKKSLTLPDVTSAESILIIDPTLIGDIVMLIPFLRIIRRNNPLCRITLACGKWAETVLKDQGLVDEFIYIDSNYMNSVKRLVTDRKKLKEQINSINKKDYDYALEPRGDLRYIYFMHYCKAKRKVSYNYTGGECFLTDVVTPSNEVTHLVEDKLYLIKSLGCHYDQEDTYPNLYLSKEKLKKRDDFITENLLEGKCVIGIHPGASLVKKQWDYFDDLLELLDNGIRNAFFVIFKGPGEDDAVQKVEYAAKKRNAEYIVSNTSIDEYMVRISACDLMICNDSGAGHIAAAYGISVFVIFGPFFPEMVRPYSNKNVFCFSETVRCKPCMSQYCENNKECLKLIKADTIANKVIEHCNLISH